MSCEQLENSREFWSKHPQIRAARRAWGWLSLTGIVLGTVFYGAGDESALKYVAPVLDLGQWLILGLILWLVFYVISRGFFETHVVLSRFSRRYPRLAKADPLRAYARVEPLEPNRAGAVIWKSLSFMAAHLVVVVPAGSILLALLAFGGHLVFEGFIQESPFAGVALVGVSLILALLITGLAHIAAAWLTLSFAGVFYSRQP